MFTLCLDEGNFISSLVAGLLRLAAFAWLFCLLDKEELMFVVELIARAINRFG